MDSISDILDESKQMLNKFYQETEEDKAKLKRIQNNDELRESVASFVVNQMQSISNTDKLRSLLEAEIMRKVALHELDNGELKELYRTISREKSVNTDSLLKLFIPTQSVSPIIAPSLTEDGGITPLSSEERNALNKLTSVMNKLNKPTGGINDL